MDAEEHLEKVFGGLTIRGDQGPDLMTDESSLLALSQWPGIFSNDVSWRLVMYPCSLTMIGSCLAMFWFYFSLLLILSFSSRPSCCCTVLRGSLSCCSTSSSRPSGVVCRCFSNSCCLLFLLSYYYFRPLGGVSITCTRSASPPPTVTISRTPSSRMAMTDLAGLEVPVPSVAGPRWYSS